MRGIGSPRGRPLTVALCLLSLTAGCAEQRARRRAETGRLTLADLEKRATVEVPAGFPQPLGLAVGGIETARAELGRHLFYERRLSINGTTSCGSCHRQELAFTDGHAQARGATGEVHPRSSMSLANVAYNEVYTWASRRFDTLERQMLQPLLGEDPVEMGLGGRVSEALGTLRADPIYPPLFERAYPDAIDPITLDHVVQSIAAFERTLFSGGSRYDRYVYWGELDALTLEEKRGRDLFFSDRLACSKCHAGFNLSGAVVYEGAPTRVAPLFHHNGLYNEDGLGGYPESDRGLLEESGRARDEGLFRAPTLRNIEVTAPYMHDGSLETLEDVLEHYASGGARGSSREARAVPRRREKRDRRSRLVRGFELTREDRAALLAFLRSLTDREFLTDPRFSDPFTADAGGREDEASGYEGGEEERFLRTLDSRSRSSS